MLIKKVHHVAYRCIDAKQTVEWYQKHESWWRRIISGEYQQYYRKMYEEK